MDQKVLDLPINQLIFHLKNETTDNLQTWINQKDRILSQPNHIFTIIFLNMPTSIKQQMFHDFDYLKRIVQIPKNKSGKSFFELLTSEEQILFLTCKKELDTIDSNLWLFYMNKLNQKDLLKLQHYIFLSEDEIHSLLNLLTQKYSLNEELQSEMLALLKQKNRSIFNYYKAQNINELLLYHYFNLPIKTKEYEEDQSIICLDNLSLIHQEEIININKKHMRKIIEELQKKEKEKINNSNLFVAGLKLYQIFGFDNAMKIIHDKFTYMNFASLRKFAELSYIDSRRQYRLEHQDQFYSYEMLKKVKKALQTKNLHVFLKICKKSDPDYLKNFYQFLYSQVKMYPENENEIIEKIIQTEIQEREELSKEFYIEQYISNSNQATRKPLCYEEIYHLFKNTTVPVYVNEKKIVVPNPELTRFLLGNEKQNNDCIIRLILNQRAFGLNQNLDMLINSFDQIKKITSRKTNSLSLYSVLDVIDVCKSVSYKLAPNEWDLTLEAISKILNNHQFCSEPKENILKRAKKLHIDRKKKYQSSIPSVSGITKDQIKYSVLNFDSEHLITCGIDTGSCLRVGGKGEEFLKYCMTSEHAVIVGLWDQEGKYYICPFIRNGNGIYGNGLDPKVEDPKKNEQLIQALQICIKDICKKSSKEEPIEFGTITDLNQEEYFHNQSFPSFVVNEYLPLEEKFYSDYHKDDKKTYILYQTSSFQKQQLYTPNKRYLQKRYPNYVYDTHIERDKERIEVLMNAIRYEYIHYISQKNKKRKYSSKRKFQPLKIEDFEYIVGNKDWFIAIDQTNAIESCYIPYDPRAAIEYKEAFISLEKKYNINLGGKRL